MEIPLIIAGAAMLLLGRKLFWLFVAVLGFTVGLSLSQTMLTQQPVWLFWLVGIAAGVAGALIVIFIQKIAIGLGGFAAGAFIALHIGAMAGRPVGVPLILVAGVVGAILLYFFFDWALIILSSAAGATLVIEEAATAPLLRMIGFWILMIVGVAVQVWLMGKRSTRMPVDP